MDLLNDLTRIKKDFWVNDVKYILRSYLLGYPREALLFIQSRFRRKREAAVKKKFIIFSSGRSGSTLLVQLLHNHPAIHCDDEILKSRVLSPKNYIRHHLQRSGREVYGFKLLSYQLQNVQNRIPDERAFLKQLTEEGFRILYLQRKNIANQALSLIYAMSRNKWHAKDKAEQEDRKITIQPETLQYYKEELEKLRKYEAQLLSGLPCLEIHYEDDLENPEQQQETMGRVFAYIGVKPARVKSALQKVTPRDHRNYILNYDDIAPLLKN